MDTNPKYRIRLEQEKRMRNWRWMWSFQGLSRYKDFTTCDTLAFLNCFNSYKYLWIGEILKNKIWPQNASFSGFKFIQCHSKGGSTSWNDLHGLEIHCGTFYTFIKNCTILWLNSSTQWVMWEVWNDQTSSICSFKPMKGGHHWFTARYF